MVARPSSAARGRAPAARTAVAAPAVAQPPRRPAPKPRRGSFSTDKPADRLILDGDALAPARRTGPGVAFPAAPAPAGAHDPDPLAPLIARARLAALERELDAGAGVAALRRFNAALRALPEAGWERALEPVWAEMAYNLESFNPVFTACVLKVQCSLGSSDYERRDACLQRLIQPLAGEYGLHADEPLGATHRALFAEWYESVTARPLPDLVRDPALASPAAERLFTQMMRDVARGGGHRGAVEQASYALGYNLAVEYLADPEKTWLLESFRAFAGRVLAPLGREVAWTFLEVHAEGEKEHAEIGHAAVAAFAPAAHEGILRRAMLDHDRDFAAYYNHLADLLEREL